jgi:hypothetical protein
MSGIYLDKEHGVAPCLLTCPVCTEKSSIALPGRRIHGMAANLGMRPERLMREGWMDTTPCNKCQEYMQMGIILIGVDEEKTEDMKNPWRTGRFSVVSEGLIERAFPDDAVKQILKQRVCYLPNEVFEMLGIPETQEEVDALNAELAKEECSES